MKSAAPITPQGDYETAAVAVTQGNVYLANRSNVMLQNKSFRKKLATWILRGCNFTYCNIAFSGKVGDKNIYGFSDQDDLQYQSSSYMRTKPCKEHDYDLIEVCIIKVIYIIYGDLYVCDIVSLV